LRLEYNNIDDSNIYFLRCCTIETMKWLSITNSTPPMVTEVQRFVQLEYLKMERSWSPEIISEIVPKFIFLKSLDIYSSQFNDISLLVIGNYVPTLQALVIAHSSITDEGIVSFCKTAVCKNNLTAITIGDMLPISDIAYHSILNTFKLNHVGFSFLSFPNISWKVWQMIGDYIYSEHVETLIFYGTHKTDLNHLQQTVSLNEEDIGKILSKLRWNYPNMKKLQISGVIVDINFLQNMFPSTITASSFSDSSITITPRPQNINLSISSMNLLTLDSMVDIVMQVLFASLLKEKYTCKKLSL